MKVNVISWSKLLKLKAINLRVNYSFNIMHSVLISIHDLYNIEPVDMGGIVTETRNTGFFFSLGAQLWTEIGNKIKSQNSLFSTQQCT